MNLNIQNMEKSEIKKLSTEKLQKERKNTKVLIFLFIPVILGLLYFVLTDYFAGGELDTTSLIIILCSIGGLVSVLPRFKSVQEELKERDF